MTSSPALQVVQLTDTHLFADLEQTMLGLPTAASLQAVVAAVASCTPKPDLLLLTGDLSQDETVASYQHLRSIVETLELPTYWLPGNHDQDQEAMAQVLASALISPQKSFQQGGWNFILLDSTLAGEVAGELSAAALTELEHQLQAAPNLPTLVALHHPPTLIHSQWMDDIGLRNPDAFYAVLDRYPQVKIVLFGHIHQEFSSERQGVQYWGTPSTCVQFKPKQRQFTLDELQPGFRLLTLYPDGRFTTEVRRVAYLVPTELSAVN
ncbi:MAG: 3',5'-cyclic-AMP phosphodiesterase [Synechococcales cyanobacterium C42_A2020_086]|jgi:Icc protein|nr:3',5'-cyclic-AMP phosphodiesterase [Synechococcales cyanobacterium C42_A2020_086]